MRTSAQMPDMQSIAPALRPPPPGLLLQRKCACGGSAGMDSECKDCNGKRLAVQRYPKNSAAPNLAFRTLARDSASTPSEMRHSGLGHNFGQVGLYSNYRPIETGSASITSGDQQEVESGHVPEKVAHGDPASGF